jgi:hypothetical protein
MPHEKNVACHIWHSMDTFYKIFNQSIDSKKLSIDERKVLTLIIKYGIFVYNRIG